MSTDVLITTGIAVAQLITTIYGVIVSIAEKHLRVAGVLGIVGGLGVGLTVWAAIRNDRAQSALQGQLDRIQQNTERPQPPPIINVNPAAIPPKTAMIVLKPPESAIRETINRVQTGRGLAFMVGQPVQMNLYFENRGEAIADDNFSFGRVYLVPSRSSKTEQELTSRFRTEFAQARKSLAGHGYPLRQPPDVTWVTAMSDKVITDDDMKKLHDGTQVM